MEAHREIFRRARAERGADQRAILRDIGDARRAARRDVELGDVRAGDPDRAGVDRAQADERLDQFCLAVAGDAGDADDLAAAQAKADAVDERLAARRGDGEIGRLEQDRAGTGGALLDVQIDAAPGHRAHDVARGGVRGDHAVDDAAVAQHGDAVGDRHHFVQLVGDEQYRAPLGGEVAHDREQAVALLRRQHGGRLVEDEDARVAIERL